LFNYNLPADGAREALKPSKNAKSHVDEITKNLDSYGFQVLFVNDVKNGLGSGSFGSFIGLRALTSKDNVLRL